MKILWPMLVALLLAGCAGRGGIEPADEPSASSPEAASGNTGRYAMSGDAYPLEPPDVSRVPDAVPRREAPSRGGNRSTYEVWGKTYRVLPEARGYARQGTASWYGEKFHGYATSNGEIYDMYKMSAAHRSLPLPSFVRVTSLDNDRSVIVRVNDRGPFHSDREIDLSYAAAARLDILDRGTGRVRVEAIDVERWLAENGTGASSKAAAPSRRVDFQETGSAGASSTDDLPGDDRPTDGRPLYLQIAALGSAENARNLKRELEDSLSHPVRVASARGMHRVQVGPLSGADQLDPMRDALRRAGFAEALVIDDGP